MILKSLSPIIVGGPTFILILPTSFLMVGTQGELHYNLQMHIDQRNFILDVTKFCFISSHTVIKSVGCK